MLDELFRKPFLLKADPSEKSYPSAKTIEDMFSNLVCIIGFHTNFFLPMIKERVESWTEDSEIGDIFTKLAPLFNLYTIYCQSYDNCSGIITNIAKKFPKFAADLNNIEKKKECKNLRLTHHMLDLIQRIPRYNLMLNEILKHSEPQSAKYENIKNALNLMSAAAHKANDRLTESFNDYIICCVKQSSSKYRKKAEFEFSTVGLLKDPDDKIPTAFGISNLNELMILKSATLEDKNSWIDEISNVISTHDASSTESNTVSLHTVMVSLVSVRPNEKAEWIQKQLTLTSENKIMIVDQSKVLPV
ncbi:FYVE, RhoGEF and PH domain-containing protein 4 [Thelohanellus kitauei]|uniref:FYVE, RhoGEF and PH domain-containing protein 4 n=1 Tax=Thelohanellus kitauei TaxID=669202 RepID=A0A0C2M1D8_THEKT|nr:FYVE, RhoGEF and PH domain-containing protein 4 [Thelohanellus kitauei]